MKQINSALNEQVSDLTHLLQQKEQEITQLRAQVRDLQTANQRLNDCNQ